MSAMPPIPEIRTGRLLLRGPRMADFEAYAAFYASDRVAHIGGPVGAKAAWKLFSSDLGHWALMGFGWWIVELEGRAAGAVGLHRPPSHPETEIGWNVFAGSEGRGVAREAAEAALAWAWKSLRPESLVSYIAPENTRSIALAERLGARLDPAATRPEEAPDVLVYRHEARP